MLGLTTSREHLYRMIDRRVDDMMEMGLVNEVCSLLKMGYSTEL
ncbi:MAG: tRNA (adenosine(37)-N6)-dimethylallyltransferase MiaA, partial [Dehalococcoidia bacterium]|nr:tRNA (adenosine(37)-N6)-dimethylallyltransferase MiaA [Dehalococcoidia bacterium]